MRVVILVVSLLIVNTCFSQTGSISGVIKNENDSLSYAVISLNDSVKTSTGLDGKYTFKNLKDGKYTLKASSMGFTDQKTTVSISGGSQVTENFNLQLAMTTLDEVVISATLKPVSKSKSPVSVEVYSPTFFKKNPTPTIFEALQNVNGVRPQLNCSVCNTGDIHINGLEGPYTMILIDGMPIVSSLSTVYGLSGIPNSLIERIEIVKGPASSLYGSEAVGGLINVITKDPSKAPILSADAFGTSWGEFNLDLGLKTKVGENATVLTGINYFNYNNPIDNNNDNFTDVTQQDRISIFQKWNIKRKSQKALTFAGRYFFEDRWGGELQWTPEYRGGDSIYGESIYTKRFELIGNYELPIKEHVTFQFSYNTHDQNSVYGDLYFLANQKVSFGQFLWDKTLKKHSLLTGLTLRNTIYDDNTTATETPNGNAPVTTWLPGIFLQDEITFNDKHLILLGARYDYNSIHGNIFTPRMGYKWSPNKRNIIRLNAGTGFRVVNVFTEDHAALTGARDVIIMEELKPEQSYNANLNFVKKIYPKNNRFIGIDASIWYTYFTNQIIPDYDTDPNQIIYDNLDGYAQSTGASINLEVQASKNLTLLGGGTVMDVSFVDNGIRQRPLLTEKWTAVWTVTYQFPKQHLKLDYTGNVYGSMDLPVLGEDDPRSSVSPIWSIQNIQLTYEPKKTNWEIYGGVKNLLDWTPNQGNPFIIARAHDPFDKEVEHNNDGSVKKTAKNPYGLTFDPTYIYGPNQGLRLFIGARLTIK